MLVDGAQPKGINIFKKLIDRSENDRPAPICVVIYGPFLSSCEFRVRCPFSCYTLNTSNNHQWHASSNQQLLFPSPESIEA